MKKKILNKDMLELGLKLQNNSELEKDNYWKKSNYNSKNNIKEELIFPDSHGDILWGRNKEVGNLYHAYCVFSNVLTHGYKEGFFEDCAKYKQENISSAKKRGWVIGIGKTSNVAICPACKEKLKKDFDEVQEIISKRIK